MYVMSMSLKLLPENYKIPFLPKFWHFLQVVLFVSKEAYLEGSESGEKR